MRTRTASLRIHSTPHTERERTWVPMIIAEPLAGSLLSHYRSLSLRSLSQFLLTAHASTRAPTRVFWCFVPKPHHPRPPLVRLLSLISCHFSVTDKKIWAKDPGIGLKTQEALGKLSTHCFVLLLRFEPSVSLPDPHHWLWNALRDKSQVPAGLWMAGCLEALLPRSMQVGTPCPRNISEWATFLIRLSPQLVTDTLTPHEILIWWPAMNTNAIRSSVKSGFRSFRAEMFPFWVIITSISPHAADGQKHWLIPNSDYYNVHSVTEGKPKNSDQQLLSKKRPLDFPSPSPWMSWFSGLAQERLQ